MSDKAINDLIRWGQDVRRRATIKAVSDKPKWTPGPDDGRALENVCDLAERYCDEWEKDVDAADDDQRLKDNRDDIALARRYAKAAPQMAEALAKMIRLAEKYQARVTSDEQERDIQEARAALAAAGSQGKRNHQSGWNDKNNPRAVLQAAASSLQEAVDYVVLMHAEGGDDGEKALEDRLYATLKRVRAQIGEK